MIERVLLSLSLKMARNSEMYSSIVLMALSIPLLFENPVPSLRQSLVGKDEIKGGGFVSSSFYPVECNPIVFPSVSSAKP